MCMTDIGVSFFSLYQEYLGAAFPFPCYQQVFLPGSAVITTSSIGASYATFSADLLADEHIIDQVEFGTSVIYILIVK